MNDSLLQNVLNANKVENIALPHADASPATTLLPETNTVEVLSATEEQASSKSDGLKDLI